MTHRKCSQDDCSHGAKYVPRICVPAKGWEIGTHPPVSFIMGFEVCDECFKKIDVKGFFHPDLDADPKNLKNVINILCRGKCPPDFDRAWIERELISCKEYQVLLVHQNEHRGTIH